MMSRTIANKTSHTLRSIFAQVILAGLLCFSFSGQAATLDLNLLDSPDILASFIEVSYDADTDLLSADGFAIELYDGSDLTALSATFSLEATILEDGTLDSGSFEIIDLYDTILLSGDLTAFGFDPSGTSDTFEFTFDVTDGDLAYLWTDLLGGIILSGTGFDGEFIDGQWTTSAIADVGAVVPLPAAFWLFGSGLLGLIGLSRRQRG